MRIALRRPATARAAETPHSVEVASPAPRGMQSLWRATLQAYGAQPACLVCFSILGFAGASLLGLAANTLAGGDLHDAYLHASGPFPTFSALGKIEIDPANGLFMRLLLQSMAGWLLCAFSLGVMAHAVMHRQGMFAACRAAAHRMPALLAVTLLGSLLAGFGAVGLNVHLRNAGFDLSNAGAGAITPQGMLEKAAMHALDQALPVVGSPVAEFVPFLRNRAFRAWYAAPDYSATLALTYGLPSELSPQQSEGAGREGQAQQMALASVVAMVVAQMLLCLGAPAALTTRGVLAPILRSAGWGMRHGLRILINLIVLQGVFAGVKIVFVVLPLVLVQGLIDPQQWLPAELRGDMTTLVLLTHHLIHALFAGFLIAFQVAPICQEISGLDGSKRV